MGLESIVKDMIVVVNSIDGSCYYTSSMTAVGDLIGMSRQTLTKNKAGGMVIMGKGVWTVYFKAEKL